MTDKVMTDRGRICAEHIKGLIKASRMPRNQIASFSGLTNTYIRDLEAGHYASVRREKLISLAVAINLSLVETDKLLKVFDRTPLTLDDISTFLSTTRSRKGSSAMLPLRDGFPLELALLSAERRAGRQVVVNPQPTFCLFDPGHRRFIERQNLDEHPIYGELVEAISGERRQALDDNLTDYAVEQYICRHCLEEYAAGYHSPEERDWRRAHIANVVTYLRERPNFHFHILSICATASFTLKLAAPDSKNSDRLFLAFWPRHRVWGKRSGRLSGFTTDNPTVIENFNEEVDSLHRVRDGELIDREKLIDYLSGLIAD